MILGLILSSVSLVLNISKYKNNIKWRDGRLAEFRLVINATSRYLDVAEWRLRDLWDRVRWLEDYNEKLLQEIVYLTKDATFPELESHPVKTIRIQQKLPENSFPLEWFWLYSLSLEIPAEDASLVLFTSPNSQAMPTTSITTQIDTIRKNQIPWQRKFRINPRVMKIPFTDWALVFSGGLKKIRFCADAFLLLAHELPDPMSSPIGMIIGKWQQEQSMLLGEASDHVEISIDIPDQDQLLRVSEVFLDAIIKIYSEIQPAGKDQWEQNGEGGPLRTSMKIELKTYKQAIIRLRAEAESRGKIPSPESWAHRGVAYYQCSVHVRLQSIDRSGNAFFLVEE